MRKRKILCLLFVLGIGFSLFQSNETVYAENELPGIVITNSNNPIVDIHFNEKPFRIQ